MVQFFRINKKTVSGRPDSLENCSVVNQTSASLVVRCQPGFDGGLSQRFVMEVYDRHGQSLAGNVTADRPAFTVGNLPSGLGFDISVYAYNSRGPSDPVQLHAYTLKSAEKRTGTFFTFFFLNFLSKLTPKGPKITAALGARTQNDSITSCYDIRIAF
jgi:hypothetical protein